VAPDRLLLGLDLGTSRIKALLVDGDGGEAGCTAVATPFDGGEMTVESLIDAVGRTCQQLEPEDRQRVAAVGIAGLAESGAPLGPGGRPQAPIIAWNDPRGAEVVERLRAQLGAGLERAIGQPLRTVSSVAKLGWLIEHGAGPVERWLGVPELALAALTGRHVTEFSLAARTGAYHLRERRYLPDVLAILGVGPVFPPVAAAGADMGRITAAGARWSGVPAGIPVTLAGHDHLAGMIGAGVGASQIGNSVGTAETVVTSLGPRSWPDADLSLSLRAAVTLLPGGKGPALLASAARSGLVAAAVTAALGCSAAELDRCAGTAATVAVEPQVIDAAVEGEPLDLPPGPPGAVWNGVLAALSERTWDAVDRLQRVAASAAEPWPPGQAGESAEPSRAGPWLPGQAGESVEPSRAGRRRSSGRSDKGSAMAPGSGGGAEAVGEGPDLVVFGGGSRSRPWLAAKARARPKATVWRCPATEAVARGAALFAGVAAGWWPAAEEGPSFDLERVGDQRRS
jgi:xylulokinase